MSKPVEFHEPRSMGERSWGEELLLVETPLYSLKRNTMKAGTAGGLQYHRVKDECAFIAEGDVWLDYDPGDGRLRHVLLTPGSVVRIPPGAVHRMTAITEVVYYEVSTPVHNDRVRCEAMYGEDEVEGLPTTDESEIEVVR